jgi:nitroreductase
VARRTIEEILWVARFAPSGANTQPWRVYALAGEAKHELCERVLEADRYQAERHVSEYRYYPEELPAPYSLRKNEFGKLYYGSLGIPRGDKNARADQTSWNYGFFGASVGLIVTIDRRLEKGSWLDLGMFMQNILLAAAGRGLATCPQEAFSKYHRILRSQLGIPEEQVVVCGISIGRPRRRYEKRIMPRADVNEFASFSGFED